MKSLAELKEQFLKQASEFDTGKKEEDFHAYLRHHNLEHYLSQTQIADRNRDNYNLNAIGMTLGIGIPLTLGAIFGGQKLTSRLIGHGGHEDFNYELYGELTGYNLPQSDASFRAYGSESLSGTNTRPMPRADAGVGQEQPTSLDYGNRGIPPQVLVSMRELGSDLLTRGVDTASGMIRRERATTPVSMEDDAPLINQNDPRYRGILPSQYYL